MLYSGNGIVTTGGATITGGVAVAAAGMSLTGDYHVYGAKSVTSSSPTLNALTGYSTVAGTSANMLEGRSAAAVGNLLTFTDLSTVYFQVR